MWPFTSSIPPHVLLAFETYSDHTRTLAEEEWKIVGCVKSLMIKGCINPQDIPTSPKSLWSAFGAPTRGDVELLSEKYNLAVGKPLEKVVTLGLLYELRDFGQRLDDWRRRLNSEYIFIPALVDSACVWPSWLPFGGNRGHTPVNEAAWEMAEKWAKVEEREKELHVWLDEASVLVGRAEELLGCSSITVGGVRGPGAMKRRRGGES